jgi:FdhD protein
MGAGTGAVPSGRPPGPTTRVPLRTVRLDHEPQVSPGSVASMTLDSVATEEPLEIRLAAGRERRRLAVTMRTPGADFELAAGFLHGEGVIGGDPIGSDIVGGDPADGDTAGSGPASRAEITRIGYCTDADLDRAQRYNVVTVTLSGGRLPDLATLERHFTTSSACGVCGKSSLDGLHLHGALPPPPGPAVDATVLATLPDALRRGQRLFATTGGLHAAGLFTADGEPLCVREDVGRHNAVDKVIGWALLRGLLPLHRDILMVSGRASYEIMQKALVAGVPVVCAVSAPSSLAVSLARDFGLTLVGFLRDRHFNVYTAPGRVRLTSRT